MQTSVRSEAPRAADMRNLSDESVHISREISIVSSPGPTTPSFPSIIQENVPTDFNPGIRPATGSGRQLKRWNSKVSDASWRYSRRNSLQVPRISQDAALLNSNRESMKALSDFLKTREPPPSNFMSIPSDDEKPPSSLKKRASRLFGKTKNKSNPPRLLQLPDSAVAAKTRSGARHIAISIPMDSTDSRTAPGHQPPKPLGSNPHMNLDRGADTVLKTVAETHPEKQSRKRTANSGIGRQIPGIQPEIGMRGHGAELVLKAYETDVGLASRRSKDEQRTTKHDPQRSQRTYIAVSPVDADKPNIQRRVLHMSDGTIDSQLSIASTGMGHSRNISSVSTAPSATLNKSLQPDLPPRTSSIVKIPTANLAKEKAPERIQSSLSGYSEITETPPSPPAVLGIAVRGYNAYPVGRPQVVKNIPRSHASHDLLSPPEDRSKSISRPATAPDSRTNNPLAAKSKSPVRRTASNQNGIVESVPITRQTRQERVRARKMRDIESVRSLSGSHPPLPESQATNHIVAPPKNPKRQTYSADARRRAAVNTLSPIMLVANVPPSAGSVTSTDLPLQRVSRQARSVRPNSVEHTIRSTHTPPRSIITSLDSETEDAHTTSSATKKSRSTTTQSLRSSILSTRRQERRLKRNMSLRECEMDARISKIESDNIMLLQTLGGIARSFGEISRIGKEARTERRTARLLDEEWSPSPEEKRRRGELEKIEPVMRVMREMAPRVSMEGQREGKVGRNSEDSYDGMSVLG
ncbi:hypothetical protein WAI453_001865 [Rhynchosporium graminicola]|uniref:Uncharacterized protein n=1 Tax=Rhynchosporium graminicola TaxID=2792576 RepID=A0A1E1KPC0_9HELO|nr:uncharacterized protein RCO7_06427 [Rhynchosporium commune]